MKAAAQGKELTAEGTQPLPALRAPPNAAGRKDEGSLPSETELIQICLLRALSFLVRGNERAKGKVLLWLPSLPGFCRAQCWQLCWKWHSPSGPMQVSIGTL